MAVSATSSFGVTPQFLSFMQFKEDSKALKSSVKTANAIEKNMQKESDKAVEDMKQFFVSIGKDIKVLVRKTTDSLGITTKMADIMDKDLGLSEKLADDQEIKDRDDNIKDSETKTDDLKEKGPSILDSLKDKFKGLGDNQTLKDIGFIALLALGLFAFSKIAEKLTKVITPVIKFFAETLIPKFKMFFSILKEDIGPIFDNLGKAFFEAFDGLGDLLKGIFEGDAGSFLLGIKKLAFDLPIRIVSIVGDAFFSIADAFLKTMGVDAPWIEDIATAFRTLPEAIDKVITDTMKFFTDGFDKLTSAYTENGLIGAIGVGFRMFYDNTIALALNLLYDIAGAIVKFFGMEKIGNFLESADFTFASIKTAIAGVIDGINNIITKSLDGIKGFLNNFLPKRMQIPLSDGVKTSELIAAETNDAKNATGKYQSLDEGFGNEFNTNKAKDATTATGKYQSLDATTATGKYQSLDEGFDNMFDDNIKSNVSNTYTDKILQTNNTMKEKTTTLNAVAAASRGNTTGSSNINVVKGGNTSNSTINQTAVQTADVSSNHSDSTANQLSMVI